MKKTISSILTLVLIIIAVVPFQITVSADQSGTCGPGLTWTFNSETGNLSINGSGAMSITSLPPWYDFRESIESVSIGSNVTSIGRSAFRDCTGLNSITIPSSIVSIDNFAFENCTGIFTFNIPNSVLNIGIDAFNHCKNVKYNGQATGSPWGACSLNGYIDGWFVYSDSRKSYLKACSCNATGDIIIPDSVTLIGKYAFFNCNKITSVTIPDNLLEIYDYAFKNCVNLTSVTFGNMISNIREGAFEKCVGLTGINIPENVNKIGNYAFSGCVGITSIQIPDAVEFLSGFDGCTGLTSITIPDNVSTIGAAAFSGCTGLTSIVIPDSVTRIGGEAFKDCSGLSSAFIGNGVTSIGERAFFKCENITSIEIPNSVNQIEDMAFQYCSGLTNVIIGNGVNDIGAFAFYECAELTQLTLGNNVKTIGYGAFYDCTKLSGVDFPCCLTSIGEWAFYNCNGLTELTIIGNNASIGKTAFSNCDGLKSVTIQGVKIIGDSAFSSCSELKNITLLDGLETIGGYAFGGRGYSPTEINVPESVKTIGSYAFDNSPGNTVVFYSGNASGSPWGSGKAYKFFDGDLAFSSSKKDEIVYCKKSAKTITIPQNVKKINCESFNSCVNLDEMYVSNGNSVFHSQDNCIIETKGKELVAGCKNSVIPNDGSVTSIGQYAFYGNIELTNIVIPSNITGIEKYAFAGCFGLTNLIIPESVSFIGYNAFGNVPNVCGSKLYSQNGYGARSVNGYVDGFLVYTDETKTCFCACSAAAKDNIYVPESIESVGSLYPFIGCSKLEDIYFGISQEDFESMTTIANRSGLDNIALHFNHIHSTEMIIEQPTCVDEGSALIKCTICEAVISRDNIPALGHDIVHHEGQEPTCNEHGWKEYDTCLRCEYTTYEEIQPHFPAKAVKEKPVAATCTEGGSYESVVYCSVCGEELSRETVAVGANGHSFTNYVSDSNATCLTNGTKTAKCNNCEETDTIADKGSALGHDLICHEGKAATCVESGYKPYNTCSRCDYTTYSVIPAKNHNYVASYFWSDDGKTCTATATCTNDPEHTFSEDAAISSAVKEDSTCTEYGTTTYTATFENELFAEQTKDVADITPKQHNYVASYFWSDDGKSCTATAACTNNPEHTFSEEATISSEVKEAPTCSEEGTTTYTARFNNKFFSAQTRDVVDIPAAGHKEIIRNAIDPTCTTPGYTGTVFCSVCNKPLRNGEERQALGHSFTNYIYNNDATYDRDGTETAKCNRCSETDTRTKPGTKLEKEPEYKLPTNFRTQSAAYNTIVTINVTLNNVPSDATVCIDGKPATVNGNRYSQDIGQVGSTRNVTLEVKQGSKVLDSETLTIGVNSTFMGKLSSFFSNFLFNMFSWRKVTVNF